MHGNLFRPSFKLREKWLAAYIRDAHLFEDYAGKGFSECLSAISLSVCRVL